MFSRKDVLAVKPLLEFRTNMGCSDVVAQGGPLVQPNTLRVDVEKSVCYCVILLFSATSGMAL